MFTVTIGSITSSEFGGMIESFLVGKEAIELMQEGFKNKMEVVLHKALKDTNDIIGEDKTNTDFILQRIEAIIDVHFDELTSKMVKKLFRK